MHTLHSQALLALPLCLILMGLLMVSPFYLPKLVKRQNKAFNIFQGANVFFAYIVGFGMRFPLYLYIIALAYGISGFIIGYLKRGTLLQNSED